MKKIAMLLGLVVISFWAASFALAGGKVEVQDIAFYERNATANPTFASEIRDVFQKEFLKRLKENGVEIGDSRASVGVKITISYISSKGNDARLLVAKMSVYKIRGSFSSLEVSQLSEGTVAPEVILKELDRKLAVRLARALVASCADEIAAGVYKEEL